MASSFEKSVKGGTKIKLAAPKSKYVEHILIATHSGEAGVAEIFRTLQNRLRDSTWTIVFKSLIIVHLMVREGEPDVTLSFVASNPRKLAISNFSDVQVQGRNIRHYTQYLLERSKAFKETKVDFVRRGEGRLKRQTVEKGLLRETEAVQHQIGALLRCDLLTSEPDNEITLTAFRLLVTDLLALFYVMNEGVINLLEHFFEMSKFDAERALAIYKTFAKQTTFVVEYLSVARQYEHATRLEVPKLKHAPTSLTGSLEEYLHDPDFEINRRQYLAQQGAKKGQKTVNGSSKPFGIDASKPKATGPSTNKDFPSPKPKQSQAAASSSKPVAKGPDPNLIDFFESIEQNQQPMAQTVPQPQPQPFPQQSLPFSGQQPPYQQPGMAPQPTGFEMQQPPPQQQQAYGMFTGQPNPSPFPPGQQQGSQPSFTGSNPGGYAAQQQSNGVFQQAPSSNMPTSDLFAMNNTSFPSAPTQQQPAQMTGGQAQTTNPFRQSMMPQPTGFSNSPFTPAPQMPLSTGQQSTNPFAKSLQNPSFAPNQPSPFGAPNAMSNSIPSSQAPPSDMQSMQSLRPAMTGTNPFARNNSPQLGQQPTGTANALMPQATGSTNPFRQSVFQNGQTGPGWQQNQGTVGGLEQLPTVPVFPRPGDPQPTGQMQPHW
ncbi:MAG: hypothetical protein M1817_000141 [Caeruleum heppii]|nr:MAG: hypothetical protein M1817_000141 [Caeruleum heppii]